MKVLYALQGTGNGHLSRALDIIPILQKKVTLDILVSGCQVDLTLPFPVKYRFRGLSFIFGRQGGVDLVRTFSQIKTREFYAEVSRLPIQDYDLVITDFEPISAWACYLRKKPCLSLSHQSAVLSPRAPQPRQEDLLGRFILRHYAPATRHVGFHFQRFDDNIFTPVIRSQVRRLVPENQGHYTVYLPAYDDEAILAALQPFSDVRWEVFSKHNAKAFEQGSISVKPVQNDAFVKSMVSSTGVLCGAGFETPAEALFARKKLLVVPMKGQYEQHCNAEALKLLGVPVMKNLKKKHLPLLADWLRQEEIPEVYYPDETEQILDMILAKPF